jgi:Mg/Co/Ni transporter MgtE
VEFLRGDPQAAREGRDYHRRVVQLQPGELARLLDAVPYLHAAELLTLIPDPAAADTLEAMSPERQLQVFEELDAGQAERLLALMAPEAATDLLGRLTPGDARRHLERLPEERRQRVLDLLRYPDDTAGGIMTNEIVVAPAAMTVGEARRALKAQLEAPDFVYYVYVVDSLEEGHLKGVLTLRQMVLANDDARLDTLMQPHLISIDPLEPAAAAARRVAENDLAALPVVSRDGRLLGAITADAAVAQIAPPAWREVAPRVFS